MGVVTILTDFGLADGYVGAMKGVILSLAPQVTIVDISHQVRPQGVREAAFVLYTAYRYFPPRTVHLVVVDPGVGGERRAIAMEAEGFRFVAPDNGVLSYVLASGKVGLIVHLNKPAYWRPFVSPTFHGRDLFAPVAAHLLRGVPLRELGEPISDPVSFPIPSPRRLAKGLYRGEVIHVDRFGNLITNLAPLSWLREGSGRADLRFLPAFPQAQPEAQAHLFLSREATVELKGRRIQGINRAYVCGAPGQPIALVGSSGHLEIAVPLGNAAQLLEAGVGDEVLLAFTEGG